MAAVLILLVLIIVNGLFVMSEIALVSARKSRLEAAANKGDERARVAFNLAENPDLFLSAAQIGITLIAILEGVYSGENFNKYLYDEGNGLFLHCYYTDLGRQGVAHWGRCNGWLAMAQVELLSLLPADHPKT